MRTKRTLWLALVAITGLSLAGSTLGCNRHRHSRSTHDDDDRDRRDRHHKRHHRDRDHDHNHRNPAPAETSAPAPVALGVAPVAPAQPQAGQVVVNGRVLSEADLTNAQATFGQRPAPGNYWYDARAGLYGYINHGTGGVVRPNFPAAPMARNVSNGDTNILINGREITRGERDYLVQLFGGDPKNHAQYMGAYDLEANGDLKKNGVLLGNVAQRMQAQQSGGTSTWQSKGGASGGSGPGCSWVYVPNSTTNSSTTVMSGCD